MTFYVGIITLHNVSLGIKALETCWDLTMLLQYIHIIQKQRESFAPLVVILQPIFS